MRFEYATAARIVFGEGSVREAAAAAASMGRRALVVTGGSGDRSGALAGVERFAVGGEPTIDTVREGVQVARGAECDVVVAIGGGSAIDAGKAIAAMMANPGDPLDYLEVIGAGKPLEQATAPFVAIPTTAGTGSEVTRNAVLASPERRVKASLRSAGMLPRLAVVDPELTYGLPRAVTVSTGLDALTQLIEPYVSVKANPMTDAICVDGLRRVAGALPRVWENSGNREARAEMSWASLLGGMALANAGLGAVHGFAAPVGGMFDAPHGAICAAVLPGAMEVNIRALRERDAGAAALRKYEEVARILTGRAQASAEDGAKWVGELCRRLEVPPLGTYGVRDGDAETLVEKAARASSMKGNPILLNTHELREIVTRAM